MGQQVLKGMTFLRYVISMHWLSINTGIMMTLLMLAVLSAHLSAGISLFITSILSPILLLFMLAVCGKSKSTPLEIKGDITGGIIGCVMALILVII